MSESLARLMQRLHRDPDGGAWYDGLDAISRRKVEDRFLRVLYESLVGSSNMTVEDGERFQPDLQTAWRTAPEASVARVLERRRLRHWSFDPKTNRIQIVFCDSVYDGDVDHRH